MQPTLLSAGQYRYFTVGVAKQFEQNEAREGMVSGQDELAMPLVL